MSKRGFLMISDAVLAFILISSGAVITHQLLINNPVYRRSHLQALTSDLALLIEDSGLTEINELLNLSPANACFKAEIKKYVGSNLVSQEDYIKGGCPRKYHGESVYATRTLVTSDNYYIIRVKGWRLYD